jgi:hypothetical protein
MYLLRGTFWTVLLVGLPPPGFQTARKIAQLRCLHLLRVIRTELLLTKNLNTEETIAAF